MPLTYQHLQSLIACRAAYVRLRMDLPESAEAYEVEKEVSEQIHKLLYDLGVIRIERPEPVEVQGTS